MQTVFTRRGAMAVLAGFPVASWPRLGKAATSLAQMVVTKDPNCGCCEGWVKHLRSNGFTVDVVDSPEVNRVKARLGVPHELQSCHTGEIAGYAIEGHVPAAAIKRLLEEMPRAKGLAVPGMPVGSPGMEVEGSPPEEYTVFLFGSFGKRPYARFKETRALRSK